MGTPGKVLVSWQFCLAWPAAVPKLGGAELAGAAGAEGKEEAHQCRVVFPKVPTTEPSLGLFRTECGLLPGC